MADKELGGHSSRGTSEATPPHADDSPEMVNQPSPPEEQRVTSSTDHQPPETADSPEEPTISTSDSESNDDAEPSNREQLVLRGLLEYGEVGGPSRAQNELLNLEIRELLEAQAALPRRDEPTQIQPELVRAAFETPLVQAALQAAKLKTAEDGETGVSIEIAKENIDEEKSDDSNQQFDVEELSSTSKSSPETIDFGSDSSPIGSGGPGEDRRGSESSATEDAGIGSESSSRIGAVTEEESSPGIGAIENVASESKLSSPKIGTASPGLGTSGLQNVGLESELSSPKTTKSVSGTGALENVSFKRDSASKAGMPVSGSGTSERVELESQSSPLKKGALGVEGSYSNLGTPEKKRGFLQSPKRKSPAKVHHLPPKRSAPFAADKIRRQSDSQMSTLLQECLAITKDGDRPGTSGFISGGDQGTGAETEPDESQTEESNMEVHETEDSQMERAESEGYSSDNNSRMEDSD